MIVNWKYNYESSKCIYKTDNSKILPTRYISNQLYIIYTDIVYTDSYFKIFIRKYIFMYMIRHSDDNNIYLYFYLYVKY